MTDMTITTWKDNPGLTPPQQLCALVEHIRETEHVVFGEAVRRAKQRDPHVIARVAEYFARGGR